MIYFKHAYTFGDILPSQMKLGDCFVLHGGDLMGVTKEFNQEQYDKTGVSGTTVEFITSPWFPFGHGDEV